MPRHRRSLDVQETGALVPTHGGGSSYSFVSERRSRKNAAAVIIDPPLELEFQDDVPTRRDIFPPMPDGTPPEGTPIMAAVEPVEDIRATREFVIAAPRLHGLVAYRDPDLCSCSKMMAALASKVVMVVWNGPVTLSPAIMREEALLSGSCSLEHIERAYDGKPWAFRHCPFEGRLIDDQVDILLPEGVMACCGTMELAVAHGRVELPEPERFDRPTAKFTDPGRPSVLFSRCPWCATEIIDLAIARHKRHRGL